MKTWNASRDAWLSPGRLSALGCVITFAILASGIFSARTLSSLKSQWGPAGNNGCDDSFAQEDIQLPLCAAASKNYVRQMKKRGFQPKLVTLDTGSAAGHQLGLLMRYKSGFRATSRLLPARKELEEEAFSRAHKFDLAGSLRKCPIFVEAARIHALKTTSKDFGRHNADGWGGALVRCAGRDAVEVYPESDPTLESHIPYKHCTPRKCLSATRTACQDFVAGGNKALLPVYRYRLVDDGKNNSRLMDKLADTFATKVVSDPKDACMFVIEFREVRKYQIRKGIRDGNRGRYFNYAHLEHWSAVDNVPGRNHIVLNPSCSTHCDRSPTRREHGDFGEARIVSSVHWNSLYRSGFDICIPQHWKSSYEILNNQRQPRKYRSNQPLCFFRGGANGNTKWDIDRIIPAIYSDEPVRGVFIQVRKRDVDDRPTEVPECDNFTTNSKFNNSFVSMMSTTKFGYAPGGGGPYSYRLTEVFAGGSIPVVTEDTILPYQGLSWYPASALWKKCAVYVSSDDLYVLGDVLRAVVAEGELAFEQRVKHCEQLWEGAFLYGNDSFRQRYEDAVPHMIVEEVRHNLRRILHGE